MRYINIHINRQKLFMFIFIFSRKIVYIEIYRKYKHK